MEVIDHPVQALAATCASRSLPSYHLLQSQRSSQQSQEVFCLFLLLLQLAEEQELEKQAAVQAAERYR